MASILRQFYGEVRKQDGTEYSKNALQGIRSAIHRHITSAPWHRNFNILKDSEFKAGNNVLLGSLKVNKRGGKNKTKSFSAISPEDMRKLMESGVLSTGSPEGLQNLVWFSLQFYLCRRGCEGVQDLKKDSFVFLKDSSGQEYVQLAYNEASKNHPGGFTDTNDPIRKMFATGGPLCPVNALKTYLSKLHPHHEALYQQCNTTSTYTDEFWYLPAKVGIKKLQGMMSKLSLEAKLSRRYTNHCLRATCISTLMNSGFDPLTVTRLSGHRNVQSVLSYCRDVGDHTKRRMGQTLTSSLTGLQQLPAAAARPPLAAPPSAPPCTRFQLEAAPARPPPSEAVPQGPHQGPPLAAPPASTAQSHTGLQLVPAPARLHPSEAVPQGPYQGPWQPTAPVRNQVTSSASANANNSIHLQRQDNTASMFSHCSIGSIQVSYFYGHP